MKRKLLPRMFAGAGLLAAGLTASAQDYPSRPIKLVVAQTPGGSGDTQARIVAAELSERLGVPVVVENKPGGAFIIGTGFVVKSPPDGHTLLHSTFQGLDIFPGPDKLPYDPDKDLMPIAINSSADSGFAVTSKLGVKNLKEFIALAKSKPGKLTFGSGGPASSTHFAGELFKLRTGVDMLHVPFKGSAALTATLAGDIDMAVTGTLGMVAQREKLVPLAMTGRKRDPVLPEVPTMLELGYPDVVISFPYGIFAPARTPQPIITKLSKVTADMVASPQFGERTRKIGFMPQYEGPEEYARSLVAARKLWHGVARDANIKFE